MNQLGSMSFNRTKNRAIAICLIMILFVCSCYKLPNPIDVPETDFLNEDPDPIYTSETISTPTNIVIFLTETIPSVTPTPRDIFETIIDYSDIPDEDNIIYYNYTEESLYLLPENQYKKRILIVESEGDLSSDGKHFSLFSDKSFVVFDIENKSKGEYLINKDYCFDYSWFPSRNEVVFECSYSLYIYDLHSKQFIDFVIAQAGDAFL